MHEPTDTPDIHAITASNLFPSDGSRNLTALKQRGPREVLIRKGIKAVGQRQVGTPHQPGGGGR